MAEKFGWFLSSLIALAISLFVTPSFAVGQSNTSCFESADAVSHALGENPETLP